MMQRAHPENPPAPGGFEVHYLQHDRGGLQHEDKPDDEEQPFGSRDNGHPGQNGTQRVGANVAHEDRGGMRVEPGKSRARACHGSRQRGDLRSPQLHSDRSIRARGDGHSTGGEAVQPIGQVDGIGESYDVQDDKDRIRPSELHCADAGEEEAGSQLGPPHLIRGDPGGKDHLEHQPFTRPQAKVPSMPDRKGIIEPPDGTVRYHRRERQQQPPPMLWDGKHRSNGGSRDQQQPAHRWSAGLPAVLGRRLLANSLRDVETGEKRNPPPAQHQREDGGQRGGEDEAIGHGRIWLYRASTILSRWRRRDPLIRTTSPGCSSVRRRVVASSRVRACSMRSESMPPAAAPSPMTPAPPPTASRNAIFRRATSRPTSRCSSGDWAPSSLISPSTATSRCPRPASSRTSSAARTEEGLELYASLITRMSSSCIGCRRIAGGVHPAIPAAMASRSIPNTSPTAVAASAFATLCRPQAGSRASVCLRPASRRNVLPAGSKRTGSALP